MQKRKDAIRPLLDQKSMNLPEHENINQNNDREAIETRLKALQQEVERLQQELAQKKALEQEEKKSEARTVDPEEEHLRRVQWEEAEKIRQVRQEQQEREKAQKRDLDRKQQEAHQEMNRLAGVDPGKTQWHQSESAALLGWFCQEMPESLLAQEVNAKVQKVGWELQRAALEGEKEKIKELLTDPQAWVQKRLQRQQQEPGLDWQTAPKLFVLLNLLQGYSAKAQGTTIPERVQWQSIKKEHRNVIPDWISCVEAMSPQKRQQVQEAVRVLQQNVDALGWKRFDVSETIQWIENHAHNPALGKGIFLQGANRQKEQWTVRTTESAVKMMLPLFDYYQQLHEQQQKMGPKEDAVGVWSVLQHNPWEEWLGCIAADSDFSKQLSVLNETHNKKVVQYEWRESKASKPPELQEKSNEVKRWLNQFRGWIKRLPMEDRIAWASGPIKSPMVEQLKDGGSFLLDAQSALRTEFLSKDLLIDSAAGEGMSPRLGEDFLMTRAILKQLSSVPKKTQSLWLTGLHVKMRRNGGGEYYRYRLKYENEMDKARCHVTPVWTSRDLNYVMDEIRKSKEEAIRGVNIKEFELGEKNERVEKFKAKLSIQLRAIYQEHTKEAQVQEKEGKEFTVSADAATVLRQTLEHESKATSGLPQVVNRSQQWGEEAMSKLRNWIERETEIETASRLSLIELPSEMGLRSWLLENVEQAMKSGVKGTLTGLWKDDRQKHRDALERVAEKFGIRIQEDQWNEPIRSMVSAYHQRFGSIFDELTPTVQEVPEMPEETVWRVRALGDLSAVREQPKGQYRQRPGSKTPQSMG